MNRFLSIICALVFCFQLSAQDRFTYITDRQFFDPTELIGYQFVPAGMEKPGDYNNELSPDEYSFGITAKNLYIKGEELAGVFSINNINTTDYGFRLNLMNARNPALQGHLKVILTKNRFVEALVFKRSKTDSEIIFLLAQIPSEEKSADKAFFTDYGEFVVNEIDSIWGDKIVPFFRIDSDRKMQQRLVPEDSVSIQFIEKIEIIEKVKKSKKKKKKGSDIVAEDSGEELAEVENSEEEEEEEEEEPVDDDEESEEIEGEEEADDSIEDKPIVKTKIVKTHFVEIRSLLQYDDGTSEIKVWSFPINKVAERTDDAARPGEEKHQISFQTEKGKELFLYLTSDRKATAFEMGSIRYELR